MSSPYSAIYAFGDSLSDAGNIFALSANQIPVSPPYVSGHFTNGPVWVQALAADLGLPEVKSSLSGGTDFAYGSAETGPIPVHKAGPADLNAQLIQFEIQHRHASSTGLYTLSVGGNDVMDMAGSGTDINADIAAAVSNQVNFISGLAKHGARDFLVLLVPDLGKTPYAEAKGPTYAAQASSVSLLFDLQTHNALTALAAADHLNIGFVDAYTLLDQVVADPQAFGFTNATTPVWSGNLADEHSGSLASSTAAGQGQYVFFDDLHPTAAAHAKIAAVAMNSLPAVA